METLVVLCAKIESDTVFDIDCYTVSLTFADADITSKDSELLTYTEADTGVETESQIEAETEAESEAELEAETESEIEAESVADTEV